MAKQTARSLRLILGDQLNPHHSWFQKTDANVLYLMVEAMDEQRYVLHHRQKTLVILSAMRRFAGELRNLGHRVHYVPLDQDGAGPSILDNLLSVAKQVDAKRVSYQEPDEVRLDRELAKLNEQTSFETRMVSSEHFITQRHEVGEFFSKRKSWKMESFYRWIRGRHDVLMDGEKPLGGEWNYDVANRKRWPKGKDAPRLLLFDNDASDIDDALSLREVGTFGEADPEHLSWPVDRNQALELLDDFVERLLGGFGPHQDAMTQAGWALHHSRLAQALNLKMLSPWEVIALVEKAHRRNPTRYPIESCEGFIRQILGWREYVRGVYWAKMPGYKKKNLLSAQRKLPVWYWNGQTKMACLRHAVSQSLDHAYAHHIQRLMLTGNFALLAGIDPDEVDAWYLGVYADAFEWVQLPNTRGMSQFADGGLLGSKPYAASANYIKKMSDYCNDCHYLPSKRVGEKSCPFNSLYWHFYDRHQDRFEGHPRIGMTYRNWQKMSASDRRAILEQAEEYLGQLDEL